MGWLRMLSIALGDVCTEFHGPLGSASWTATAMPGGTAGVTQPTSGAATDG